MPIMRVPKGNIIFTYKMRIDNVSNTTKLSDLILLLDSIYLEFKNLKRLASINDCWSEVMFVEISAGWLLRMIKSGFRRFVTDGSNRPIRFCFFFLSDYSTLIKNEYYE